jgi:transcriptional regulator with XRE-family HTH domain
MTVGDRIKERRLALKLSQDELAKKVGYKSRSSIQKIESARNLPLRKVAKMASALDCSPSYLMGWQEGVTVSGHTPSTIITVDISNEPEPSKEEIEKAMDLFKRFKGLPPEKQTALLTLLEVPQNNV